MKASASASASASVGKGGKYSNQSSINQSIRRVNGPFTCQFTIVHGQFELNRKCAEVFDDLNTHDMKILTSTSTSNESSHVFVRSTSNFIVIAIERVFP